MTPDGADYDNGMKLCREYDGRRFPDYHYRGTLPAVKLAVQESPDQEAL